MGLPSAHSTPQHGTPVHHHGGCTPHASPRVCRAGRGACLLLYSFLSFSRSWPRTARASFSTSEMIRPGRMPEEAGKGVGAEMAGVGAAARCGQRGGERERPALLLVRMYMCTGGGGYAGGGRGGINSLCGEEGGGEIGGAHGSRGCWGRRRGRERERMGRGLWL